MKLNKNWMLGATAGALVATGMTSAYAADVVMEQPPQPPAAPMAVAPVATWAGPYAGIALGYGFEGKFETDDVEVEERADGFVGSAFAGWNGQSEAFVYGVEGDVGYNGMDVEDGDDEFKYGVDGSLRARLGYAITNDVLVYGTAGGAATRIKAESPIDSDTATAIGWTAGAGTDVKLTEQSFARLEYRYTDYGSETLTYAGTDQDVDASNHRVMVGFGMQF
ncbi:outer membrane protein [Chelativorans sp. YIM 93263]|uniref:outer membrane protein n=1 Tax=Chelativorans sp. YIM 93263 TaxID=2906648 RepID=UPI0023781AE5|nr:outer membrane protein [Chelativorans sp. YIM 93263]